ncbi:MAG TPA: S8 family serine peptidase [Gaiellaceae bacterium]|nr:S8 family serine peptidase [Gaiellaceae bacterium]
MPVRSLVASACLLAAIVSSGSADASLQRIQRTFGEQTVPRVRPGGLNVRLNHGSGRTRVIVTLGLPPLAETGLARNSSLGAVGATRKLNVASVSARAYLARIDAEQAQAVALLRRAIPEARVSRRFRVLLDGFTVSLPARRLAALSRLDFVRKVYPSLSYTLNVNRSPGLIGAPALRALTGVKGDGMKVAVVDDGIDQENPFLAWEGMNYPAGFPKGAEGFTTQKVIVARSFPGPGSGVGGRQPLDKHVSFHGTHVAGIIAGREDITAPDSATIPEGAKHPSCNRAAGGCIPGVAGLTGMAPRAWIGNYRVFTVPSPLSKSDCCTANTPEIIAAFEAAVADGMDVINFSGGGPQSDPPSDAMIATVANVARAGVVPVISAGNDRELFGLGSVGSPSTAPDAISVAAVSNVHVFLPAVLVSSPGGLPPIPFVPVPGNVPVTWTETDQTLVDVGTMVADRTLCSATLPSGSLQNAIALVSRGSCQFTTQSDKVNAAGAAGIIIVDNLPGEANGIPFRLSPPGGMIADLDGARLRAAMAATGGRATIRIRRDLTEIDTGRGGTPTAFSAGGLTAFGHDLKPDVSAPGGSILSSTVADFAGSQYAVLDGTSFSAPHVAGAAALLLQLHSSWSPKQVKSALMSTAGPAWADTARTREAPVYLEGAGLVRLTEATNPLIFTDPQSLSFEHLNVSGGAASRSILVQIADGGGGGGAWQVEVHPQLASAGATVSAPPSVSIPPGGVVTFPVVAQASGDAVVGDDYGFVVLRQSGVTRRIPYGFAVTRPKLAGAQPIPLQPVQNGDTRNGVDRARAYRWPTSPFGLTGLIGADHPVDEEGAEQVYFVDIDRRVANVGAVVVEPPLQIGSSLERLLSAPIHPWFLGSLDENDVQGYAGTPVNANSATPDFLFDVGTAGTIFPRPGRYYVSVDSGRDPFTGRSTAGPYVLHSWIDDVRPPSVQLLTPRVSAGRPSIALRATDTQAGVDPLSIALDYSDLLIGAALFDRATGIAVVPVSRDAPRVGPGRAAMRLIASDYQEAKNVNTDSENVLPNTRILPVRVRVVAGPTVTWLAPEKRACVSATARLDVVAGSSSPVSSVGFFDGNRQLGRLNRSFAGVYSLTWKAGSARRGAHTLTAIVSDTAGREAKATRRVRVCG